MTRNQQGFFKRVAFVKRELEKRGNKIVNLKNAIRTSVFENAHFNIQNYNDLRFMYFGGQLETICEILPDVETVS